MLLKASDYRTASTRSFRQPAWIATIWHPTTLAAGIDRHWRCQVHSRYVLTDHRLEHQNSSRQSASDRYRGGAGASERLHIPGPRHRKPPLAFKPEAGDSIPGQPLLVKG